MTLILQYEYQINSSEYPRHTRKESSGSDTGNMLSRNCLQHYEMVQHYMRASLHHDTWASRHAQRGSAVIHAPSNTAALIYPRAWLSHDCTITAESFYGCLTSRVSFDTLVLVYMEHDEQHAFLQGYHSAAQHGGFIAQPLRQALHGNPDFALACKMLY